jgi:thymidylate synthase (FAD)
MRVRLIGWTVVDHTAMLQESGQKWMPDLDDTDAGALTEFAGRQCYESWDRPNPATATNTGYLANVTSQQHFSVMEHAHVTIRASDVSRSLTHELVRHRHISPSQLSQRFVEVGGDHTLPPLYEDDEFAEQLLHDQWESAIAAYDALVARWMPKLIQAGKSPHRARKMAREAARSVLPNMTPTAIVLTANHRTWREFLEKRGSVHADAEIRQLALAIFPILLELAPTLYQDFALGVCEDEQVIVRTLNNG